MNYLKRITLGVMLLGIIKIGCSQVVYPIVDTHVHDFIATMQ